MDVIQLISQSGCDWLIAGTNTVIVSPDQTAADELADTLLDSLAKGASNLKGEILIRWNGAKCPYRITASLDEGQPIANQITSAIVSGIFTGYDKLHIPVPLLQLMLRAAESDRPVSIVRQRDKRQLFVNNAMEIALQTPAEEAVQRVMNNFWRPADLAYVDQQINELGQVEWRYDAGLRSDLWAYLYSRFERHEIGKEVYGLTTFLDDPEPAAFPADLLVR